MSAGRLVWDKTGERYWETGCSQGVLYVQNASGEYPEGVVWNGLTAVTESPGGAEANDMYADDIKYASIRSAETFGGTIEAYTYPDEFMKCDGGSSPVSGVVVGQQNRNPFGFCYKTKIGNDTASETDDGYKLHLIYNATASPSEKGYQTVNESPEAITFSWEISTTPVPVTVKASGKTFKPTSSLTIDTTKLDTAGKAVLEELEDILYGKDAVTADLENNIQAAEATTARLPLPDEVLAMFLGDGN